MINWTIAPTGTTHHFEGDWYKKDTSGWWCMETSGWKFTDTDFADILFEALAEGTLVPRPVEVDWTFAPKGATHAVGQVFYKKTGAFDIEQWTGTLWSQVTRGTCIELCKIGYMTSRVVETTPAPKAKVLKRKKVPVDFNDGPNGAQWFDPKSGNWLDKHDGYLRVYTDRWSTCSVWSKTYPKDRWIAVPKIEFLGVGHEPFKPERGLPLVQGDNITGTWLDMNQAAYGRDTQMPPTSPPNDGNSQTLQMDGTWLAGTVAVPVAMLNKAAAAIGDRASERDQESERSMATCVSAFNAMYGHSLSETEGWMFMVMLKMSRAKQGSYQEDDYVDMAAYSALAGESAS